jgi:serine protease Do
MQIRSQRGEFNSSTVAIGVIVGCLIGAAFYAGHEFWPKPRAASSLTDSPSTPYAVTATAEGHKVMALSEDTVANIAAESNKSVVNIDTATAVVLPESPYNFPREFGHFLGPDFSDPGNGHKKFEQHGQGSGVIIKSDGYILTNNHVVRDADQIRVTLADKRTFAGKVVGRDSFTDLALVKIDGTDLPVARLGDAERLRPGDWAIAIGSPVGLSHTVTLGIISALGRSLGESLNVDLIQTDAAINPGNSGGPLLNIHGDVVGINTAIRSNAQNIGFAIPIDIAKNVAQQLLENGKIARAWVGVYMQDLTPEVASRLGIDGTTRGVVLVQVAQGSPADRASLEPGDIIQKVDGQKVETAKDVQMKVRSKKPGDKLRLTVLHDRTGVDRELTLADFPQRALQ